MERLTGLHVLRFLPRGIDVFHDVNAAIPAYRISVIFDVGANVGQTTAAYVARFPAAKIFCFEPVAETFRQLVNNTSSYAHVRCFRLALSSSSGTGMMRSTGTSRMNRLVEGAATTTFLDGPLEEVPLIPLEEFCRDQAIDHISYLKIDTEGNDLKVLEGANRLLEQQRIDLVEVEAGMNRGNQQHVSLDALKEFLERHGYLLFGVYEQTAEWPAGEPQLRRANSVFISRRMIAASKEPPEGRSSS